MSPTPHRRGSSYAGVKPAPGSQLALLTDYSYHACITDREGDTLELEADHRRHAEIENAIRDLKYGVGLNHLPSGRFPANAAWLAVQVMAHNLARWTARIGLGELVVTTKTLRRRFFSLAGRITRKARRLTLHLPQHWPWENQFSRALERLRALPLPFLTPPSASDPSTRPSNRLVVPRQAELRGSPAAICPTISPSAATREPSASPWHSCLYPHPLESGGVRALHHHPRFSSLAYPAPTHPFGGFGLRSFTRQLVVGC